MSFYTVTVERETGDYELLTRIKYSVYGWYVDKGYGHPDNEEPELIIEEAHRKGFDDEWHVIEDLELEVSQDDIEAFEEMVIEKVTDLIKEDAEVNNASY